jgi:hypothetical protein
VCVSVLHLRASFAVLVLLLVRILMAPWQERYVVLDRIGK